MKKIKELIKNPWIQLVCIVTLLSCYWSWDIMFTHEGGEYITQQEIVQDTAKVIKPDSVQEHIYQYKKFTLPPPESESGEEEIVEKKLPSEDLEWKYKWWDMILGHISSILGSIVALAIPAYNFWSKRNKK